MKCEMTLYYLLKITYYRKRKTNKKNIITDFKAKTTAFLYRLSYITRLAQGSPGGLISSYIVYFIYYSQLLTITHSLWKLSQRHSLLCFSSVSFKVITKQRRTSPGGGEFLIRG